jgi:hypothetical protein
VLICRAASWAVPEGAAFELAAPETELVAPELTRRTRSNKDRRVRRLNRRTRRSFMHVHAAAKCRRHSAYYACGSKMPSALCMRLQNAVGTLHAAAKCRRHIMILPCMPSAYYDSALHACHHTYKSYSISDCGDQRNIYMG